MEQIKKFLKDNFVSTKLHWTTLISEKILLAVIGALTMMAAIFDVLGMVIALKIELGDLFLLFIYAEIIGMVKHFIQAIEFNTPIIIVSLHCVD